MKTAVLLLQSVSLAHPGPETAAGRRRDAEEAVDGLAHLPLPPHTHHRHLPRPIDAADPR